MKKRLLFKIIIILSFVFTANISFGTDTFTLKSYFPTPYAEYKTLRIVPRDDINLWDTCNIGTLFSDSSSELLYACQDYGNGYGEWGLLNTNWTQIKDETKSPTAYYLYPSATASDPSVSFALGIGTTTPLFKLQLNNNAGILATGELDSGETLPFGLGEGTRLMWYPYKGAFRAGQIIDLIGVDDYWEDLNIGEYSIAIGRDVKAGNASDQTKHNQIAFGNFTEANGQASTAFGQRTMAMGDYSLALGVGSTDISSADTVAAIGKGSVAMGEHSYTSGDYSVIIGDSATTTSYASFVSGEPGSISSGDTARWEPDDPVFALQSLYIFDDPMTTGVNDPFSNKNAFTVLKNGYVGINTNTPECPLDLAHTGFVFLGRSDPINRPNSPGITLGMIEDPLFWGLIQLCDILFDRDSMISAEDSLYFISDADKSGMSEIVFGFNQYGALAVHGITIIPQTSAVSFGSQAGQYLPEYKLDMWNAAKWFLVWFRPNSNGVSWNSLSSIYVKENVAPLTFEEANDITSNLTPIKYISKKDIDKDNQNLGFIAEDMPDLLATEGRKNISELKLTAVLTKTVQYQQNKIEKQKEILKQQKEAIEDLRRRINNL